MMEESPEATAKREDMLKMYHACKESLRIIGNASVIHFDIEEILSSNCNLIVGDVSMATVTTPVPPPVKNDWLSSGAENPRLSPPSPGGPRKAAPVQQVIMTH